MFSIANIIIQNGQNTGLTVGDFHKLIKTFKHGNSKKIIFPHWCTYTWLQQNFACQNR